MPSKFSRQQAQDNSLKKVSPKSQGMSVNQKITNFKTLISKKFTGQNSNQKDLAFDENTIKKYNKIIFASSFMISFFLLFTGIILLLISSNPSFVLYGLIAALIGCIQIIIDLGWIWLIKINRSDFIKTWRDAFGHVAKVRGSRIFVFPLIIDIIIVILSAIYLFIF